MQLLLRILIVTLKCLLTNYGLSSCHSKECSSSWPSHWFFFSSFQLVSDVPVQYFCTWLPPTHTFCIMLDVAYDIEMDVDWSEELKGLLFKAKLIKKKETNPMLFYSFPLSQARHTTCARIQHGEFLTSNLRDISAEIPITYHSWLSLLLFFPTLGDMIP